MSQDTPNPSAADESDAENAVDGSRGDASDPEEPTNPDEPVSKDAVEAALRRVRDPESDVTVFDAGLVENLEISGESVTIEADLREFPRESAEQVSATMVRAVSDIEEVAGVHVEQIDPSPDLDGRASGIQTADRVIAVASAKGGVGKTTVATMLACALAVDEDANHADEDSSSVGLFDADIYGPNVPAVLEATGPVYSDDDGKPVPIDVDGLEVMSMGLLSDSGPLAWRGAMAHDALSDLYEDTAWSDPDTIVVDMPPGTGDVALTTLQEVPIDGVVLVTTPFHAAVSDTHRSVQLFEENDVPVLGVVANMGTFVCDECDHPHDLFEGPNPIESLEVPILEEIPFSPTMQETPRPTPDGLTRHARDLGAAVTERFDEVWEIDVPENAVDLRDVPSDERRERVKDAFESVDSGERLYVVSDRDPTPVRGYLRKILGDEAEDGLESFEVKRQNPETWLARATRP
ncbi:P-loop NTPase [Halopenitus sp. H-Gu1]|uniref:P-loop NTPase n=1 Tax=Halopenitus sp. H-Gu1 TaxID=3242697 RepID=UPI00359E52C2